MQLSSEDKIFYWALVSSALFHAGFLIQWSLSNSHYFQKPTNKLEVVYQQISDEQLSKTANAKKLGLVSEKETFKHTEIINQKEYMPESFVGQKSKFTDGFKFKKSNTIKIPSMGGTKKITLAMIKPDKEVGARHYEYEKRLGAKIRARANFIAGDIKYPPGNVFVAFILQSNGSLVKIKILNERTQANQDMRKLVLRTVKESAPFQPFKNTKLPERTFKVNFIFSGL